MGFINIEGEKIEVLLMIKSLVVIKTMALNG
jgi:hypothetical protein